MAGLYFDGKRLYQHQQPEHKQLLPIPPGSWGPLARGHWGGGRLCPKVLGSPLRRSCIASRRSWARCGATSIPGEVLAPCSSLLALAASSQGGFAPRLGLTGGSEAP